MGQHEYEFAHRALTGITFSNPLRMLAALAGDRGLAFLERLWASVGEGCGSARPPEGLARDVWRPADNDVFAAVTLPSPAEPAEAYFALIVWRFKDLANDQESLAEVRFFTLEMGAPGFGVDVFLCEWTSDGIHRNLGAGPQPTLDAFIPAVQQILDADTNDA